MSRNRERILWGIFLIAGRLLHKCVTPGCFEGVLLANEAAVLRVGRDCRVKFGDDANAIGGETNPTADDRGGCGEVLETHGGGTGLVFCDPSARLVRLVDDNRVRVESGKALAKLEVERKTGDA